MDKYPIKKCIICGLPDSIYVNLSHYKCNIIKKNNS